MRDQRIVTMIDADGTEFELYSPDTSGPFLIREAVTGLDMAAVDLTSQPRVGPGSSLAVVRYPARTIVLPMFVDDLDALAELREAIPARPNRLRITTLERQRELLDVYYVAGLEGNDSPDVRGDDWRKFDLELVALDPLFRDEEESIVLYPPEVNDDYDADLPYDSDLPYDGPGVGITAGRGYDEDLPYDSDLPYDGGGIFSPVITSRLGAWPTITFHGPALEFEVILLRTGQRVASEVGTTLMAGTDLVVTSSPTARDITIGGQSAWDQVSPDSDAGFLLLPDDSLSVLMTGTTAESSVTVSWRQMWRQL